MIPLDGLLEALRLKSLPRAGWVRRGVPAPESVAAHSWGLSLLAVALLPPELDRGRALTYAALHDLAEVRVGDLTPADNVPKEEKARREAAAMASRATALGRPELLAAWHAYEAQTDAEARFIRELDRLDMALQAVAYAEAGAKGMAEFLDSAAKVIRHPTLLPILEAARARLAKSA